MWPKYESYSRHNLFCEIFSNSLLTLAGVCTVSLKIEESRDEGLYETLRLTGTGKKQLTGKNCMFYNC